jgi:predicted NBD/HSP70 family sugar kinase
VSQAAPAGQHTVRRHNSALVLGAIADSPGISRAGIAARTGLTKATVSSLVERMAAAGLVTDGEPVRRRGPGRRGTALALAPAGPRGLGIEIGVDYLATCLLDFTGQVVDSTVRPADHRALSTDEVLAAVAKEIRATKVPLGGVGLAVPGLVEPTTGRLRLAPNLGWSDVDLRGELAGLVGGDLPIVIGNEADFAALGELWDGGHEELGDFVYVSGEVGIGAGIVIGGELFHGVHGLAGEIGHIPVYPQGPACACGARGCLERVAGQDEILRRADLDVAGAEDRLGSLVQRLRARDRKALAAIAPVSRWLGIALSTVVNLLDVPTIVLGGAYATLEPWLSPGLLDELSGRVVSARWSPVRVLRSTLGSAAAVRGAAGTAVRTIRADPDSFVANR